MKVVHFIEMRVFSREGDDRERIEGKIRELFPFDFKKEKINYREQTAYGFEDRKIKILFVTIDKDRHARKVIENLLTRLDRSQKDLLLEQLESRLDEHLHFFIRLDKDKLLDNIYEVTDSGNCFHFTFAIAAYPHKRSVARDIVREILK